MAVGSIASHRQYLVSMHVLLITAAGCPLHGPELFIHTNRHNYAHTHTQNIASDKKLAFLPPLPLSFPALLPCSLSLAGFSPGQREEEQTKQLQPRLPVPLLFLTSRSPRCLLMGTCLAQHIPLPACLILVSNNSTYTTPLSFLRFKCILNVFIVSLSKMGLQFITLSILKP